MYAAVLLIHSWLRYAVLGLGAWLLLASLRDLRAGEAKRSDRERLHAAFLGVLDLQFLLGLLLYVLLSPITRAAFSDFGAAMRDPNLRFFGVEHVLAMLLAVAAAHVGRARGKRKQGKARAKTTFVAQLVWLVLTLAAIPWPFLDVGRPLFRW